MQYSRELFQANYKMLFQNILSECVILEMYFLYTNWTRKSNLEEKVHQISVISTEEISTSIAKIHNLLYSCSLSYLLSVKMLSLINANFFEMVWPACYIFNTTLKEICIPHSNHPIINIYSENCNSNCQKQCISIPTYILKCVLLSCLSFYFIFFCAI